MKKLLTLAALLLTAACAQPESMCPCCEKMKESGMEECCCKGKTGGKKMCMHGMDKAKPKQSTPGHAH